MEPTIPTIEDTTASDTENPGTDPTIGEDTTKPSDPTVPTTEEEAGFE